MVRVAALLLLGGCNLVFGVGEPTSDLLDADGDGNCWAPELLGNEDMDMLSDGCDPCPADADPDGASADSDQDGVGDRCDQSPSVPNRWTMFAGFHDPAHDWTVKSGVWAVQNDALESTDSLDGVVTREIAATSYPVVEVAITSTSSLNLSASASVELAFDLATARCGYRYGSGSDNLVLEVTEQPPIAVAFDAPGGLRIRMSQDDNGRIHCDATSASGRSDELRSAEITSQVATRVTLTTELTPAAFQWVSVYGRAP